MTNEGKEMRDSSRKRHGHEDESSGNRKRKTPPVLEPPGDDLAVVEENGSSEDDDVSDSGDEDGSSNNEIKIKVATGKIITLKVQDSDTIGSMKLKIQDEKGIPVDQQELLYRNMVFNHNSAIIANLRIKGSTLSLLRRSTGFMTTFVKPLDTINGDEDDKSPNRKVNPLPVLELSHNDIAVVENGSSRNDDEVEDCNSGDKDDFTHDEIKIETSTGKIITLKVQDSDTIGSLKLKIQDEEGIPFDQQELVFNRMLFADNSAIIANLGIKRGSTLTLVRRSMGLMTIFVKPFVGPTCSFEVRPSDTIDEMRTKIWDAGHLYDLLTFNGIAIRSSGTLADFGIINGSILTCIAEFVEDIKIYVKDTSTGKTISMSFFPEETIAEVKSDIESDENIPCDEQTLIFNNMVLGDEGTLADFHIYNKSTLTLMRKSKGFMVIFIDYDILPRAISQEVGLSATIGDIKDAIKDLACIPSDEMELIFNNMVLDNSGTIADFQIKHGSRLTLMRISTGFMRIFVNLHTGRTIGLKVKPSYTITEVKSMIYDEKGLSPCQHTLMFKGKKLEDGLTEDLSLADYNIQKDSTLYLVPRS